MMQRLEYAKVVSMATDVFVDRSSEQLDRMSVDRGAGSHLVAYRVESGWRLQWLEPLGPNHWYGGSFEGGLFATKAEALRARREAYITMGRLV